jgi:hypothetical protein
MRGAAPAGRVVRPYRPCGSAAHVEVKLAVWCAVSILRKEMVMMPPHCDSLDGPVVESARQELISGDVAVVLAYVPDEGEDEVSAAFDRVLPLQDASPDVAAVARRWFFETVVRVHRAGEHAPFTGLKPAGLDVGPVIPLAEKAVESGDSEDVYHLLAAVLRRQLTARLAHVRELAAQRDASVAADRRYVQAMLGFEVYANQVYAAMHAHHHGETA